MTVASKTAPASNRAWGDLQPSLSPWLLDAISSMNFQRMTPVQASTIPLFMGNKDVVVEAVTGSGKTLAFLIPAIEKLLRVQDPIKKHHIGAIIISPTRELATQIYSVLQNLLAFHPPSAAHLPREANDEHDSSSSVAQGSTISSTDLKVVSQLILGGTTTPAQDLAKFLKTSPNLIVATPGRLLELLSSSHVHCPQSSFELLIMDEADRLLDPGFADTLQKVLTRLPKQRRTGLFSASMSEAVEQLIRVGLRNPVRVAVRVRSISGAQDKRTPASLQTNYITTKTVDRWPAVAELLSQLDPQPQKSLIYLSTCAAVDYWQHILPSILPQAYSIIPLHGKHPPNVRTKNFSKFLNATTQCILLTTDVAARGLDVPNVDLVIQIDPPSDPKTYIHRCGRAGRAGRKGLAVLLLNEGKEQDYIEFLRIRGTPIAPLRDPVISCQGDSADVSMGGMNVDASADGHTNTHKRFTDTIRKIVLSDRAIYDKAQRAFVSWVRSYAAHSASSIFDVKDLDWLGQAASWGLLRLPKMPELKKHDIDRSLGLKVDLAKFEYKDAAKEKKRIAEAEERANAGGQVKHKREHLTEEERKDKSWSRKKDAKSTREDRRTKKGVRRERQRIAGMNADELSEEQRLQGMIAQVRAQVAKTSAASSDPLQEEFHGFDD